MGRHRPWALGRHELLPAQTLALSHLSQLLTPAGPPSEMIFNYAPSLLARPGRNPARTELDSREERQARLLASAWDADGTRGWEDGLDSWPTASHSPLGRPPDPLSLGARLPGGKDAARSLPQRRL